MINSTRQVLYLMVDKVKEELNRGSEVRWREINNVYSHTTIPLLWIVYYPVLLRLDRELYEFTPSVD